MSDNVNIISDTRNGLNQLINGSLQAIARTVEYSDHPDAGPPFLISEVNLPGLDSAVEIAAEKPKSETIGGWKIWGSVAQAIHRKTDSGTRTGSSRGGVTVQLDLLVGGTLVMEQPIDPFEHLVGQDITFSVGLDAGEGSVTVTLKLMDGDTELASSTPVASKFVKGYKHIALTATLANNINSLQARVEFTGDQNTSVKISDIALVFGTVKDFDTELVSDLSESARPRGTVLMVLGEVCPPGYRLNCEFEERLAYTDTGDVLSDQSLKSNGQGGSFLHNHGGTTLGHKPLVDNVFSKGGSKRVVGHKHPIDSAESKPPYFKALFCEKI